MKLIEQMTVAELRNEIKSYVDCLDKEKGYAFVSYSHMDCEIVYRKVLEWMRAGYNVYLDVDFENRSSDDNWVDIMKEYVENINCKVAICFRSAHYYSSYAALLELLTIRGKVTRQNHTEDLKIEILQCDKTSYIEMFAPDMPDGIKMKELYAEKHKKYVQEMKKDFLSHNRGEANALKEGIEYFYKKNKAHTFFEEKDFESAEEIINWIKNGFNQGPSQFFRNLGELSSNWFTIHNLNGNYKEDISTEQLDKYGIKNTYNSERVSSEEIYVEESDLNETNTEESDIEEEYTEDDDIEVAEEVTKKTATLTGDISYTLYGEKYTENQSDMMLRFFAQVLKRHEEFVTTLPEYKGMNCASNVDYTKSENRTKEMPSYFRVCQYFSYPNGQAVCIGTAYAIAAKLQKMALLLQIVGEDRDIFSSEQVELPTIKSKAEKGTSTGGNQGKKLKFTVYGEEYEANQSDMLGVIFNKVIEKNPHKLNEIANTLSCVDLVDYTDVPKENRPCYFSSSFNVYEESGVKYSVGGGFSMKEKLRMIGNLIALCEENADCVTIENAKVEVSAAKGKGKAKKEEKKYL